MNTQPIVKHALLLMCTLGFSLASNADTFRCERKLASVGDTKADVLEKCGEPQLIDSFCRPIVSGAQLETRNSQGDTNTVIAANSSCENVDIWTYKRGTGHFMAHLYFSQGQLQEIKRGERTP